MPFLQFKGKTAIESYHRVVPHHVLEVDKKLSLTKSPGLDGNLIIEGDNLIALKSLLPTHAGRIKCVYIDPPYNTGNEGWIYNDNLTQPQFKEWIGKVVGKEGEDATRHDKWCCMMYPRLQLLKELLRDDGIIMISIDDNEVHHLRLLLDEIFGASNLLATIVWEKGRKNDAKLFSVGHEYIIIYAKSKRLLVQQGTVWREPKPGALEIWQEYRRLRAKLGEEDQAIEDELRTWFSGLPASHPSKRLSRYKHVDKFGPWRDRDISWPGAGGPTYDVFHPVTKKKCKMPESGWRFSTPQAMQRQIELGLVVFREDHTNPPFRKAHLRPPAEELDDEDVESVTDEEGDEADTVGMQVMPSVIYKQSQVAIKYLRQLMGVDAFENPKDHEVIARLVKYCTAGDDLVLDSFAGSGTTGEAVLEANRSDGGSRRFVIVQQAFDTKDNERAHLNICEQRTRERIRRVIVGYKPWSLKARKGSVDGLGGEFTYFRVGARIFDEYRDLGDTPPSYEQMARYIWFTETSRPFDASQLDEKAGRIGEWQKTSYYLLYSASKKDARALDADFLRSLKDENPRKVIYCEKIWIHRDTLREFGDIRAMLVPFNLK